MKHIGISSRFIPYDMARGIGIVLVVVGHTLAMHTYGRALVYSFHMPLFFIISGAVMKPKDISNGSFAQRLREAVGYERRLLVNYVFYSVCFILFDISVRYSWLHMIRRRDIAWDVYETLVGYGINVLWFLITLSIAKVAVRLLCERIANVVHRLVTVIISFLIGAYCGELASLYISPLGFMKLLYYPMTALFETVSMTAFVLFGYALHLYIPVFVQRYKWVLLFLFVPNILLCYVRDAVDVHLLRFGFPPLTFILSVTGSVSIIALGAIVLNVPLIQYILSWLSSNSLFIMITHEYFMIAGLIVSPFLNMLQVDGNARIVWQIILILLCEIPLCLWIQPCANRIIAVFSPRRGRHAVIR